MIHFKRFFKFSRQNFRKPGGSCSYVSHHYKSQCSQVYNYHRLLSWDDSRGLHMDIYKVFFTKADLGLDLGGKFNSFLFQQVPSCCSCHIMGYSYVYPPLSKSASSKIDLVDPLPTSPPGKLIFYISTSTEIKKRKKKLSYQLTFISVS